MRRTWTPSRLAQRALAHLKPYHERVPYLRNLPLPAVAIVSLVALVNVFMWAAAGIVLHYHSSLISTALLSYTLGLRHALDADHISAIDVMTRRLIAAGQRPVTVGTFFSLGHSTIVIITCLVVASTAAAISDRFGGFGTVGGIIGSTVSAVFLIVLGAMNMYILVRLVQELRFYTNTPTGTPYHAAGADALEIDDGPRPDVAQTALMPGEAAPSNERQPSATPALEQTDTTDIEHANDKPAKRPAGGPILRLLRRASRLIDRPWKMYPLGVLFGLGFDTSSEIALLGIAALSGAHAAKPASTSEAETSSTGIKSGQSIWLILLFPLLFTAGMCLLDTLDGAAMMALYSSARLAGDRVAVCYYQVVLTGVTVLVAVVIGTVQVLNMVSAVASPTGKFWDGVERVGEHYDIVGGAICGSFVVFGGAAAVGYRPWRRWIDGRRERLRVECDGEAGAEVIELADKDPRKEAEARE